MAKNTETTATATATAVETDAKRGPGRPPVDPNETPAARFKRLATFRVNRVLDDIATIGNLAGSAYEYTPEQVAAIFGAIEAITANTREKFAPGKASKSAGFSL